MLGSPVLQVQNTGPLHFFLEHSLAGYLLFVFSQEDTAFAFYRDIVILFHGFTSFSMCRSPIEDNILSITACLLGILSFTERWGWEMKKVSLGTYKRVLDKSEAAVCRSHLPLQK